MLNCTQQSFLVVAGVLSYIFAKHHNELFQLQLECMMNCVSNKECGVVTFTHSATKSDFICNLHKIINASENYTAEVDVKFYILIPTR